MTTRTQQMKRNTKNK